MVGGVLGCVGGAVGSAEVAKVVSVGVGGVGEDLNLCLLGWGGGVPRVVLQLGGWGGLGGGLLGVVLEGVCLLRGGWGVDGVSLVVEGFCGVGGGGGLVGRFVGGDGGVGECLVVGHVWGGGLVWVVVPYVYEVGRVVRFGVPRFVKGFDGFVGELGVGLVGAFGMEFEGVPEDAGEFFGVLRGRLAELGFVVVDDWSGFGGDGVLRVGDS